MWIRVRGRAVQKAGNAPGEYEDAFFPRDPYMTEARGFRAAVADGATETSYSGEWARELAEGYCRQRLDVDRIEETLPRLQGRWNQGLVGTNLPWYAQEKLRAGAYSSLVGLTIGDRLFTTEAQRAQRNTEVGGSARGRPPSAAERRVERYGREFEGAWKAVAAGDSCLFHLRAQRLLCSFPIAQAEEFSNHPALLSSLPAHNSEAPNLLRRVSGTWRSGDTFVLATDAVAHWLLDRDQEDNPAFASLSATMGCPNRFARWVGDLRTSGAMRNDDVTVLEIDISETNLENLKLLEP